MEYRIEQLGQERPSSLSTGARALNVFLSPGPILVEVLLALLVFLAPLAIEGIPARGQLLVEGLLALTVVYWLAERSATPVVAPLNLKIVLWPALALLLLFTLQVIPLPNSWVALVSPLQREIATSTFSLLPPDLRHTTSPISVSPWRSVQAMVRFLLVVGLIFVARDRLRGRRSRNRFLTLLIGAGLAQVFLGFLHKLGDTTSIYFIPEGRPGDPHFFGSFVGLNRNAAYLNMLWPLAMSLGLEGLFHARRSMREGRTWGDFLSVPAGEGLFAWPTYLLMVIPMVAGVVLCNSRMGWMIMFGLFPSIAFAYWARSGHPRKAAFGWSLCTMVLVVSGLAYRATLMQILSDWAGKSSEEFRYRLWESAWRMAVEHPLFGAGLGSFFESFGPYNPAFVPRSVIKLENAYIETLSEIGFIGGIVLLGAMAAIVTTIIRNRFWEERQGRKAVIGLVAGLGGLAVHATVDLTFRGYGTIVTGAILLGMLLAALEEEHGEPFSPAFRYGKPPPRTWLAFLSLPPLLLFIVLGGLASYSVERAEQASKHGGARNERTWLETASKWVPWASGPHLWLGVLDLERAKREWAQFGKSRDELEAQKALDSALRHTVLAERLFSEAIARAPMAGHPQRLLSRTAELSASREFALASARDAVRVQPTDYRNWAQLAGCLDSLLEKDESLNAWKRALELGPVDQMPWLVTQLLKTAGGDTILAEKYIPDSGVWNIPFVFGQELERNGQSDRAMIWYRIALQRPIPTHISIVNIGWRALNAGDYELTQDTATLLKEEYPYYSSGYTIEAELRLKQGKTGTAAELFKEAARVSPPGIQYLLRAARILSEAGRVDEALREIEELEKRFPYDASIVVAEARMLWQKRERALSIEALHKAKNLRSDWEEPRWMAAQLLNEMGLIAEADRALDACVRLARAPRCKAEAGRRAMQHGDYEAAIAWLEKSVAEKDAHIAAWCYLAESRARLGDLQGAKEAVHEALGRAPHNKQARALASRLASEEEQN